MRESILNLVEAVWFQRFIIAIILLNAVTLGLETAPQVVGEYMPLLAVIDAVFLGIFTVELGLKLYAYKLRFFKNGWNNFDFIIVGISYLPFIEGLSVLRSLRILRVLRLISVVPQFKKVTQAFIDSLSGMSVIASIMVLVFYVGAVMATKLFGETFPEWFGSIGKSLFSLFQIMTLESWSSAIARPVMEVHPYSWLFFVVFILVTTFVVLNLIIGVIVNSMQTVSEDSANELDEHLKDQDKDREDLKKKLEALEKSIQELKRKL